MKRSVRPAIILFAFCAVSGLGAFVMMAWRATSRERLQPPDAARRLEASQRFDAAGPGAHRRSHDGRRRAARCVD